MESIPHLIGQSVTVILRSHVHHLVAFAETGPESTLEEEGSPLSLDYFHRHTWKVTVDPPNLTTSCIALHLPLGHH